MWEGTVVKTYFTLGDKVSKGQLLAEIRSTEGNTLQATLSSLESRIKAAERKKENLKHLLADGMASQTELEEAIADLEVLKSEKVRAQTESKWNHSQEGYFKVYAPTSGVVTEKSINIGEQVVAGGEPMFVISDLEDLWLMLNIYASNVQRIQEGMEVSISTLSFPGELFSGRITKISPAFDEDARVLKARSTFENRGGKLKPGMTVDVTAWKKAGESAVAVPVSALVFSDNQYYVLVHHSDCKVEVRKVEIAVKTRKKHICPEDYQREKKLFLRINCSYLRHYKHAKVHQKYSRILIEEFYHSLLCHGTTGHRRRYSLFTYPYRGLSRCDQYEG